MQTKSEMKKEIEHLEWYVKRKKSDITGPYSKVYSTETKKFVRAEIKRINDKIKVLKKKLKSLK